MPRLITREVLSNAKFLEEIFLQYLEENKIRSYANNVIKIASYKKNKFPKTSLKPKVQFFTTDKNLYYFAKFGLSLFIISPKSGFQRFYYPDINSYNGTDKIQLKVSELRLS